MDRRPDLDTPPLGIGYRSQREARAQLETLVARGGCWRQVGTSVEGRAIEACTWTLGTSASPPASLFLLSLVHPMEWIGREIHLGILEDLLAGRIVVPPGTRVVSLVDANPDGTARVEAALRAGRAAWVRGNARGVDLNRNFPEAFRTRPAWIDFWPMWRPGPSPLSEPEACAILEAAALAAPPHPGGVGTHLLALSFHSFGRWIFYPPSSTRRSTTLAGEHERRLAPFVAEARRQGYRSRQLGRFARWFRAYGTEIDALALGAPPESSTASRPASTAEARLPPSPESSPGSALQPSPGSAPGPTDRVPERLAYLVELSAGGFGRWGLRRLFDPFFTFNPPDPAGEYRRIFPILGALIPSALSGRDAQTAPFTAPGRRGAHPARRSGGSGRRR